MNKFQKASLAVAASFGLSFAQGGSLWGADKDDFPSLQVQVPAGLALLESGTIEYLYDYKGGFWFGYVDNGGNTEVRKEGEFVPFGQGTGLTDESDGASLIDSDGLYIRFNAAPGEDSSPSIAGIGFNFKDPANENSTDREDNISSYGGYCISYASSAPLQFELGWLEGSNGSVNGYDTWYTELPANPNGATVTLTWNGEPQSGTRAGDFKKDGWEEGAKVLPITTATEKAVSVKIRLKNQESDSKVVAFALSQLGWLNDNCNGSISVASIETTPVISLGSKVHSIGLIAAGGVLSFSGIQKPASVQVINLQGAVVSSQTMSSDFKINVSNLPTGIYMVRVPSQGYTNKVIIAK